MIDFINRLIKYLFNHSFEENAFLLTLVYFMFIYFPIRLLSIFIITPMLNNYIEPRLCYNPVMNAGMAIGFRITQRLGKKRSYHKYVRELPKWLDNLVIYFFVNDIGMMIVFVSVVVFYKK